MDDQPDSRAGVPDETPPPAGEPEAVSSSEESVVPEPVDASEAPVEPEAVAASEAPVEPEAVAASEAPVEPETAASGEVAAPQIGQGGEPQFTAPGYAPLPPAGVTGAPVQPTVPTTDASATAPVPPPRRRSRGAIVAITLLSIALLLALGAGAWVTVQYLQAKERISDQDQRISEQEDEIEEQRDLIDEKESFGAAMDGLMDTASKFDGVLMASIVPWHEYEVLAERGWNHRWDARKVAADTKQVELAAEELAGLWDAALQEASSNATGSAYESVIDSLGGGFVSSVIDEQRCGQSDENVLGCVFENEPYIVHFDASGNAKPFMTDELRAGIAYHEFAHVLQFTNPAATEEALKAFGGDYEVMADCFALTYLDGWTLDHRIWVSDYEYWDVSIGYGQNCSEPQRQTVRDWYAKLGVELQQIPADASA